MLEILGIKAKEASKFLMTVSQTQKNNALSQIAKGLMRDMDKILLANNQDIENGKKNELSEALLDRLKLDEKRVAGIAAGIEELIKIPDPVGVVENELTRPNGLHI